MFCPCIIMPAQINDSDDDGAGSAVKDDVRRLLLREMDALCLWMPPAILVNVPLGGTELVWTTVPARHSLYIGRSTDSVSCGYSRHR